MKIKLLIFFSFCVVYCSYSQDERITIDKIDSLNTLASFHYDNEEIEQSIRLVNNAIKLSDSINDSYGKALANLTFGNIYFKMNETQKAKSYYNRIRSILDESDITNSLLLSLSWLGHGHAEYKENVNLVTTIYSFEMAIKLADKFVTKTSKEELEKLNILLGASLSLGSVYIDQGLHEEAMMYLLRAKNLLKKLNPNTIDNSKLTFLYGRYFAQVEAYHKSIDNYKEVIEQLENSDEPNNVINLIIADVYKEYAKSLEALGNKEEAYEILLQHNLYREKVINEERIKQSQIAKIKLDNEAYRHNISRANKEKILQEAITKETQRLNTIIIIGIVLLFICLVTLYSYYLSKRKLSNVLQNKNEYLLIAKQQAEESSKLKSKFISNVSHELRTPLYGVVGLTSLLLKNNDLSDRDHKFLKSLKFSGDYLLNLINDVLQIGKMESDKVELNSTTINLKKLSENILDSFEYQLEEKQNKLHLDFDKDIPEFLLGDNVRLSQILINLIGNSFKFTTKGNIWLKLEVLTKDEDHTNIRFSVKDDGPGIPKDKQQVIFDNFSQLHKEQNVNYQGTGLGLSIVKNLIALFGSKINLVSEEGKGAEFSFNLELKIDKEAISKSQQITKSSIVLSETQSNILVVEDNKINQIVTRNILEKDNFNCDVVENGLLAVSAVKKNHYDLVLMDLNMPVMDGFEATVKIRAFNAEIPIVALTAANIEDVKEKITAHGFSDVIIKPYDNYEFYQKIIKNIYQNEGTAA